MDVPANQMVRLDPVEQRRVRPQTQPNRQKAVTLRWLEVTEFKVFSGWKAGVA